MKRIPDLRSVVIAIAFLAIGFLAAERMTPAAAAPAAAGAQDLPGSFSGTTGTLIVTGDKDRYVIIVRDRKVYRLPVSRSGENGNMVPWVNLAD